MSERGRVRVLACLGSMATLGGLERTIVEVVRSAVSRGGTVHCILSSWSAGELVPAVEAAGATWSTGLYRERLRRRPGPRAALRLTFDMLRTSGGLLRDAARFRPTCVLLPEFGVALRNWPAMALLRLIGVPTVLAVRNAPGRGRFHARVWRWLVRPVVGTFVCASDAVRRDVVAYGIPRDRTLVVGSVVPLADVSTGRHSRDLFRVVYVGQMIPPKGIDLLIDAVALVRQRGVPATLEVLGRTDGWVAPAYRGYRERMIARANEPDLRGAVQFLGWRDDVVDRLAAAGVHCCPSRPEMFEGLPRVVIEAKVAGTPTLAFAHGPFPELIDDARTGWLVDRVEAPALAERLEAVLKDPGALEAMADTVRRSARRFDPEESQRHWWAVLSTGQRAGHESAIAT